MKKKDVLVNVNEFLERYKFLNIDKTLLLGEIEICKFELKDDEITLTRIKTIVTPLKYPLLYKVLQLCLTIPISSAKSERSISALRKVHNFNRASMLPDRISSLSSIQNDTIIDEFSNK